MKLQLPDVTLVCIDTICHELAALAVRDCMSHVDFGAVQIHTDKEGDFELNCGYRGVEFWETNVATLDAVAEYMWHEVPKHIETSHALFVHWDSGVVDPEMWTNEFLEYDYIGAPWGWHGDGHEVGNGGFSLRSKLLMDSLSRSMIPAGSPEDDVICRLYRPSLEKEGLKFAPAEHACNFSFERTIRDGDALRTFSLSDYIGKHFGFHGIFNWPIVFSDEELNERVRLAEQNEYLNQPKHLGELKAVLDNKFPARV